MKGTLPSSRSFALIVGAVLLIGTVARAQQLPPVNALGPAERASKDLLGSVIAIRALRDGRVLVSEYVGQQIVRFDSSLSSHDVAADARVPTCGTRQVWRTSGLIAYKGDSSLLLDPELGLMKVLDGGGRPVRTISTFRKASQLMGPSVAGWSIAKTHRSTEFLRVHPIRWHSRRSTSREGAGRRSRA